MKNPSIPLLCLLLPLSCAKETESPSDLSVPLSEIHIPVLQVPLYADLSDYSNQPRTRSSEEVVSLESLLDKSKKKKTKFEGVKITQIPFKEVEEYPAYYGYDENTPIEEAVFTKKFYIKSDGEFIVTMITGYQYAKLNPDFDFLDKPNYTGAILFSELDGTLIKTQTYSSGLILQAKLMTLEEASKSDANKHYIRVATRCTRTRSLENHYIWEEEGYDVSICVADGNHGYPEPNPWIDDESKWNNLDDHVIPNTTSGGGGGNKSGNGTNTNTKKSEPQYTVTLTTNNPSEIIILGSGSYAKGTRVGICSQRTSYVTTTPCKFIRWTGTFAKKKTDTFNHKVAGNVVSTAYYDAAFPCIDNKKGVANPIAGDLAVAATESGSYANGLYNAYRGISETTGKPKYHAGLDIAAEPGTPVYSMYDGTIIRIDDNAPYHNVPGPTGAFGNRVIIEYNIDGKKVYFQYSHLQNGTPVANNPRENRTYKAGDPIYAGEPFAYTGKSGNAWNVPNKHLDLTVSYGITEYNLIDKNKCTDPMQFLNAELDQTALKKDTQNAEKAKMKSKNCD